MAKKQFKIRAKLVFGGYFTVRAHSKAEAEAIVQKDCGGLLGKIECSNTDDDVDWDFNTHGEIVFNRNREKEGI